MLKVMEINRLQIAVFMFSYFNNLLPQKFIGIIFPFNLQSKVTVLVKVIYILCRYNKYNFSRNTITFTSVNSWNKMPNLIVEKKIKVTFSI